MSSVLVVSTRGTRISLHRRTLSQSIRVGVVTLSVMLILLIATVLVAYLMASNVSATKGYVIKELKQERETLHRTAEHLTMTISQAAALDGVAGSDTNGLAAGLVLPEIGSVAFVEAQAQVAKK